MYLSLLFVGCCYFLSSAVNPFLYSLLSKRFRRGFHDLKYKILLYLRIVSSRPTTRRVRYGRQLGTRPIWSIRNNQSISFQKRQPKTQTAPNSYFARPTSSSKNYSELHHKRNESIEIEMLRVANVINNRCNHNCSPVADAIPVEIIEYNEKETELEQTNETFKKLKPCSSQTQAPKMKSNYIVLYKPDSKDDATHLSTLEYKKKENAPRKIPRCECMIDLRSVGKSSAVHTMARQKGEFLYPCSNSYKEEQLPSNQGFSINAFSS